ncbi:MAG: hypothetical protein A2806_00965 [Candidatus Terrybacteria bacterium RIFCSPHIGHO2_01_FULL_48_17]|uniref:ABC transporter n=1 Tax=Candidatus Terrybacteria bacterium RIFCSPHIGHO2_01_FULL_48_17 TaxID=1802362 RepID=A0A1G2PK27_9BACT|nr:MAG: hypothetical protein A2806_00965 [Candidatus Terrybacteria bacterium RIFCSPHIGHO2_01_FULL_48_17]OHA51887.1 MAG: hypothetical protein A3A30_00980 [Candidatus Terrybacteria bacterium RIFCSPLOWO2_01_FULL_48_14]
MDFDLILTFMAGAAIAAAAGVLGVFAVMKRMALAGDVLSHVAFPGVALALTFSFSPSLGAALFLFGAAYAIWAVRTRTKLPEETVIGVFFVSALAVGALLFAGHEEEVLETLFGGIETLPPFAAVVAIIAALLLIILMVFATRRLVLSVVSPELAASAKIKTDVAELLFLLAFAAGVLLGYRFAGTLLMGALIIVPAATAQNMSSSLRSFLVLSAGIAVIATITGLVLGSYFSIPPGPPIILVSVGLFALSLAWRRA